MGTADPAEFRIVNATLVLPDRLVPGGALHVRDGRIIAAGAADSFGQWEGATVDAGGRYAAPG